MTQVLKHSRFLFHCTLAQPDAGGAKAMHGRSRWGFEVAVTVEPTTRPWYLLPRGAACSCNTVLAQSHVELPQGGKYPQPNLSHATEQTERRNALLCSLSCFVRLPWGTSILCVQKHTVSTKSLHCLPQLAISWETSGNTTLTYHIF